MSLDRPRTETLVVESAQVITSDLTKIEDDLFARKFKLERPQTYQATLSKLLLPFQIDLSANILAPISHPSQATNFIDLLQVHQQSGSSFYRVDPKVMLLFKAKTRYSSARVDKQEGAVLNNFSEENKALKTIASLEAFVRNVRDIELLQFISKAADLFNSLQICRTSGGCWLHVVHTDATGIKRKVELNFNAEELINQTGTAFDSSKQIAKIKGETALDRSKIYTAVDSELKSQFTETWQWIPDELAQKLALMAGLTNVGGGGPLVLSKATDSPEKHSRILVGAVGISGFPEIADVLYLIAIRLSSGYLVDRDHVKKVLDNVSNSISTGSSKISKEAFQQYLKFIQQYIELE
ncbi:MAG: hypothetical protein OHK0017_03610 [Patescibacteria group bacterium]